jgi:hypothetical protein
VYSYTFKRLSNMDPLASLGKPVRGFAAHHESICKSDNPVVMNTGAVPLYKLSGCQGVH